MKKLTSHLYRRVAVVLTIALLSGCDSAGSDRGTLHALTAELRDAAKEARGAVEALAPKGEKVQQQATQEVEKLFIFEYKVVDFDLTTAAPQLEESLNLLGADRWECGTPLVQPTTLRFVCRRRPKTYLRYLPRFIP